MFRAQPPRTAQLTPWEGDGPVTGVALLLPGGFIRSRRGPLRIAELGLRGLAAELTDRSRPHGLAVHLLRYRYSGWNGADADTAVDTRWALDELERRYPGAPVVLIGNSLGGRAAFWCAGHPNVAGVAGIVLILISQAWWFLIVGAAAVAAAWFYTGGKKPYGYMGLGEVFVFIFFGLVAVGGTAYAITLQPSWTALLASIAIGLLAVALIARQALA